MSEIILKTDSVSKVFQSDGHPLNVLKNVTFAIDAGSTVAVVGPSGSGKSTLLGLCAGLDEPTTGTVILDGQAIAELGEDERAALRNRSVGFVFQSFQLISTLTALENVMVPAELQNERRDIHEKALQLLGQVGLAERLNHYPVQLSGGEQQRVALARAFINDPKILFADEPTGNLDNDTGKVVENLLFDLNESFGTTLVLVTHNQEIASRTERVIRLKAGMVVDENGSEKSE